MIRAAAALLTLLPATLAQSPKPAAGKKPHIGEGRIFGPRLVVSFRLLRVSRYCVPLRSHLGVHRCPLPVFHLVDDWGWANAGWHANSQNEKVRNAKRAATATATAAAAAATAAAAAAAVLLLLLLLLLTTATMTMDCE